MNGRATVLLLVVAGGAAACAGGTEEEIETTSAVPVKVEATRRGTVRAMISAAGAVRPAPGAELEVVPPDTARIAEMPVSLGDRVRRGALLVRFDIPASEAELAKDVSDLKRAGVRLDNARVAAARVSGLFERGIAARKEVEDAQRELAEAEAEVAQAKGAREAAQRMVARESARAPFDGVVVARTHNPGDVVDASTPGAILRLIDPTRLNVEATVTVDDLRRLVAGAPARILGPESFPPEEALVRAVPAAVDPTTAIATVRLDFTRPTTLPEGTPVRVEIASAHHDDALLVRSTALVRDGQDTFVYTVGADNVAHRKKVAVGLEGAGDSEILSGLSPGERVVVEGASALPDGATVTIRG